MAAAAAVLAITARQVSRLLVRFRDDGGGGLIHKSRGQLASNKLATSVRELVLELVRQNYCDFGPIEVSQGLAQVDGRRRRMAAL